MAAARRRLARAVRRRGRRAHRTAAQRPEGFDETHFDPEQPAPTLGGNTVPGLPQGPRDHRRLLGRPDVAVYRTEPLERELEITGPVSAVVHLASTAETIDVVAMLACEEADGRLLNLCDGIARVAGAQIEQAVELDLLATSVELAAGVRLCLLVHHSNFPRFDVNPGVAGPTRQLSDRVRSTQRIFRTSLRPTRILLPTPSVAG